MVEGGHRRERLGMLAGLFFVGLALRPQIIGIGPLMPEIQHDLGVSHAIAGLLGTIPLICMSVFAFPAPMLSRRYGARTVITVSLAMIAAFGIARVVVPGAALVIALTVGVGIGLGVAQAVMPVAVKERFAHRPAFATGIYVAGINLGSAVSSAVAVPLADASGGWRGSLAWFSAFTGLLVLAWWRVTQGGPSRHRTDDRRIDLPWRHGITWLLVLIFGLCSFMFYGLNAWLPDSYVELGWDEGKAGRLLATLHLTALPTVLLIPWVADHYGSRRLYLVVLGTCILVGCLGFVLRPAEAWVWAALIGVTVGGLFPLVMTLPIDVGHRPAEVAAVAGMMLGFGYAISALAPWCLGVVRDLSGSFTAPLWVIAASAALTVVLCVPLTRERLHRETLGRPA